MDTRPVGVFASGIGGLTAVRELKRLMPNESIVYFGDTARCPYGGRSREAIMRFAMQDIGFLLSHNVKAVVAACGTASSVLGSDSLDSVPVPFTGVLLPAVQAACALTQEGKIGVIGTSATVRSQSSCQCENHRCRMSPLRPPCRKRVHIGRRSYSPSRSGVLSQALHERSR